MNKHLSSIVPMLILIALCSGCARSYHITESFSFTAKSQDSKVSLAIQLPVSCPYQQVSDPVIEWTGEVSRERTGSSEIVRCEGLVKKDEITEALISYDINLKTGKPRWEGPVEDRHLRWEKNIESNDPALKAKGQELAPDQTRKDAYRLYKFVGKHLKMLRGTRIGSSQSAKTAYETGTGVCGDYANLMVALCRAAGIPAQTAVGMTLTKPVLPGTSVERTWNHPGIFHGWAEIYTEKGWEAVDVSLADVPLLRGLFFNSHAHLIYFGEKGESKRVYEEQIEAWAKAKGQVIAAMSAPNRFAVSRTYGDAFVTPKVKIKKRWFNFKD